MTVNVNPNPVVGASYQRFLMRLLYAGTIYVKSLMEINEESAGVVGSLAKRVSMKWLSNGRSLLLSTPFQGDPRLSVDCLP